MSAARKTGGRLAFLVSATAFAVGLAAGSALVFGGLGLLGRELRPGPLLLVAAAALAGSAALADIAGVPVRLQLRRQVPERWRRTMSLSRALFLYGALLGTGVSTYVPALAAWALLGLIFALGNVVQALAIGLAFALGRALPVLLLAPGSREDALSERPGGLRATRLLAAATLAAAAAALLAGSAQAKTVAYRAEDPSADGTDLAWQRPGVGGFLRHNGAVTQLPGSDPALGGGLVVWRNGSQVTVADVATETPILQEVVSGVQKLAISSQWLVYRRRTGRRERLFAESLAAAGEPHPISAPRPPGMLGRPAIDGSRVVFSVATRSGSWITSRDLSTGAVRQLRHSRNGQLLNPSLRGSRLVYARIARCSQQLRAVQVAGGRGRRLFSLPPMARWDAGHEGGYRTQGEHRPCKGRRRATRKVLWTTALSASDAYVTVLEPTRSGLAPKLVSVPLR